MKIRATLWVFMMIISSLKGGSLAEEVMMKDRGGVAPFVVVGGSAAGTAAVQELCARGCKAPIVWIADQPETPYNTIEIPEVLAGVKEQSDIEICSMKDFPSNVTTLFGKRVVSIDSDNHMLTLDDGSRLEYGKLLLAIGAKRGIPTPFNTITAEGLFLFCRLPHALAIKEYIKKNNVESAVIVGLGLNGTELHDILTSQGIKTHAVDRHDRILYRFMDEGGARFMQKRVAQQGGVTLHLNSTVQNVITEDNKIVGLTLQDGTKIPCQLLLFTAAGTPDRKLLESAGVEIVQDGVKVDNQLRSSQPDIYAAGDVAAIKDLATKEIVRSRKWRDAQIQGKIAAAAMLGDLGAHYEGTAITQDSHLFNLDLSSCGSVANPPPGSEVVTFESLDFYHQYLLKNGRMIGFLLVGPSGRRDGRIVQRLKEIIEDEVGITRADLQKMYVV